MDFDYGIIEYKHRFSVNRSLDDYAVTRLEKCITVYLGLVYKTMACDKLVYELQIIYRDENFKSQCLKLDLHDWQITVKYKGDMGIII